MILNLGDEPQQPNSATSNQQTATVSPVGQASDEPVNRLQVMVDRLWGDKIDPYALLGVPRSVTDIEADQAFQQALPNAAASEKRRLVWASQVVGNQEGRDRYDAREMTELAKQKNINAFMVLGILPDRISTLTSEEIDRKLVLQKAHVEQTQAYYKDALDAGSIEGRPLTEEEKESFQSAFEAAPLHIALGEFARKLLLNPYARAQHVKNLNIQVDDGLSLAREGKRGKETTAYLRRQSIIQGKAEDKIARDKKGEELAAKARGLADGKLLDCFKFFGILFANPSVYRIEHGYKSRVWEAENMAKSENPERVELGKKIKERAEVARDILLNKEARKIHLKDLRDAKQYKVSKFFGRFILGGAALAAVSAIGLLYGQIQSIRVENLDRRDAPPSASKEFNESAAKAKVNAYLRQANAVIEVKSSASATFKFNEVVSSAPDRKTWFGLAKEKASVTSTHYLGTIALSSPPREVQGKYCYNSHVSVYNQVATVSGTRSGSSTEVAMPVCLDKPIYRP